MLENSGFAAHPMLNGMILYIQLQNEWGCQLRGHFHVDTNHQLNIRNLNSATIRHSKGDVSVNLYAIDSESQAYVDAVTMEHAVDFIRLTWQSCSHIRSVLNSDFKLFKSCCAYLLVFINSSLRHGKQSNDR